MFYQYLALLRGIAIPIPKCKDVVKQQARKQQLRYLVNIRVNIRRRMNKKLQNLIQSRAHKKNSGISNWQDAAVL
ncbi:MAG TPA: hypothetical protein DCP36_19030 [Sporomusaceae bacterium]|nr:hypothetical protein [Sporomusaceae bacterium]